MEQPLEKIVLPLEYNPIVVYRRSVFFYETDAAGIFNNVNMFRLFEEARTMFLAENKCMDILHNDREDGPTLVVAHAEASYKKPAYFMDELEVTCKVIEHSRSSFTIGYEVIRHQDHALIATGNVVLVAVNKKTMRPIGIEFR